MLKAVPEKLLILLILCLISSCGLAFGQEAKPGSGNDEEPVYLENGFSDSVIHLGSWGPLTGSSSPWGAGLRGMETYLKMINNAGGIHGRSIKLLMFDNKGDPAVTEAGVKMLMEERGVFAFVGGAGAASNIQVLDEVAKSGIPWIGPAGGSSRFIQPLKKNIFAINPLYRDEAAALVKYSVEVLGLNRVAVIYQDDEYGREGLVGAQEQMKQYGMKLYFAQPLKPGVDDIREQIMALEDTRPETVILWVSPIHAVMIRKIESRMKKAGVEEDISPVWMCGSALADTGMMNRMTGGLWKGTIFTSYFEPAESRNPLLRNYHKAYRKFAARGEYWGPFFYTGFGRAEPLVEALKRCGPDLSRKKFIEQLQGIKGFKGIFGRITYGPKRRQGQHEIYLGQALKGDKSRLLTDWFVMN